MADLKRKIKEAVAIAFGLIILAPLLLFSFLLNLSEEDEPDELDQTVNMMFGRGH